MSEKSQTPHLLRFEYLLLLRRSEGAMTEAEWQAHLRDEPGMREWYEATLAAERESIAKAEG